MSANPRDALPGAAELREEVTRPYAASRKIYVEGSRPDLRVGMREVVQSPTPTMRAPGTTLLGPPHLPPHTCTMPDHSFSTTHGKHTALIATGEEVWLY